MDFKIDGFFQGGIVVQDKRPKEPGPHDVVIQVRRADFFGECLGGAHTVEWIIMSDLPGAFQDYYLTYRGVSMTVTLPITCVGLSLISRGSMWRKARVGQTHNANSTCTIEVSLNSIIEKANSKIASLRASRCEDRMNNNRGINEQRTDPPSLLSGKK